MCGIGARPRAGVAGLPFQPGLRCGAGLVASVLGAVRGQLRALVRVVFRHEDGDGVSGRRVCNYYSEYCMFDYSERWIESIEQGYKISPRNR